MMETNSTTFIFKEIEHKTRLQININAIEIKFDLSNAVAPSDNKQQFCHYSNTMYGECFC